MNAELHEIATLLAQSQDPAFTEEFLRQLLTPDEVEEIEKRWLLVKLLHQGRRQRDIARELHMSLCKITRGSKELKKQSSAFLRALARLAAKPAD